MLLSIYAFNWEDTEGNGTNFRNFVSQPTYHQFVMPAFPLRQGFGETGRWHDRTFEIGTTSAAVSSQLSYYLEGERLNLGLLLSGEEGSTGFNLGLLLS